MKIIVFNSSNLVADGDNNKLIYKFPNSVVFKDNYIAVNSINLFYSWDSISTILLNNTFTYLWYAGAVATTYTIIIPDGTYELNEINAYLQFKFISNGHYLQNGGQNIYYAELILNTTRYAVQVNTYLVPISLPAGYTNPALMPFPTQTFNPVLTFPSKFSNLVGFPDNFATNLNQNDSYTPPVSTIISKNGLGTISYLSPNAPQLQPNSIVYISMSNIDNSYAQPNSIIYAITPSVQVGQQISNTPPQLVWNKLLNGVYNQLRLTILGTDLNPIVINDPTMTFLLVIRGPEDMGVPMGKM
jgi:hypothetical protein